jgi:hypothetical protein
MIGAALAAAGALALLASGPALADAAPPETGAPAPASPGVKPLENLQDIAAAFGKCWTPPALQDVGEMTVMLSLRRDGSILGEPRITYTRGVSPADKSELRASLLSALATCGRLSISPILGAAIAGHRFTIRFFITHQKGAHDI